MVRLGRRIVWSRSIANPTRSAVGAFLALGALGLLPLGHGLGARAALAQNVYALSGTSPGSTNNSDQGAVTVYPRGADGNVAPLQAITGPATHMSFPRGLAVDNQHDEIVVGDSDRIFVYPRMASGNASPIRTINLSDSSLVNLAVDMAHGELLGVTADSIVVYARTASGNDAPLRRIQGAATGLGVPLGHPVGIAVDPAGGEIYVTRAGGQSEAVLVYARTADGNAAPIRQIDGPGTGLGTPEAIAVDTVNGELLVLNATFVPPPSVTAYPRTASGNATPLRTIGGASTGMASPLGLAVDAVSSEIFVANRGNSNSITVYSRTANGNAAPLRTIGGGMTMLSVPNAVAVDQPVGPPPPPTTLVASVLPNARAVQVKTPVTVDATIINAGSNPALQVGIALATPVDATFGFQRMDTSVKPPVLVGAPGDPVDIAPGGHADFLLFLTPNSAFGPAELAFTFAGTNTPPVTTIVGVNTLLLLSSVAPTPDIVAVAGTIPPDTCPPGLPPCPPDGIVRIPGVSGIGVFSVATTNLGIGDTITVTADTGATAVPVAVTICETNPVTGACLAPPSVMVTTSIAAGAQPTFGFFVSGTGAVVVLDPAVNRVFARFHRSDGLIVGGTSVAVVTQ